MRQQPQQQRLIMALAMHISSLLHGGGHVVIAFIVAVWWQWPCHCRLHCCCVVVATMLSCCHGTGHAHLVIALASRCRCDAVALAICITSLLSCRVWPSRALSL